MFQSELKQSKRLSKSFRRGSVVELPLSNVFHVEKLHSEKARLLASEISNETGRRILKELYKNPSSVMDLSNKLSIPASTVQYHVYKLMELGVIKIAKKRLGKRLRDVKMYVFDKEGIVFLSAMSDQEFESLFKSFVAAKIREKALTLLGVIALSCTILSLVGSWLLKREIERIHPSIPFIISGQEISIWGFFIILSVFFLTGAIVCFLLIWYILGKAENKK